MTNYIPRKLCGISIPYKARKSSIGSTSSTNDLKKRMQQHNNGEVDAIRPYLPIRLVYYESYVTEKAVREREASIKKSGSVRIPLMRRIRRSLQ